MRLSPKQLTLCSQEEAIQQLVSWEGICAPLTLEVREEKCFQPDKWLSLGEVQLFPALPESIESEEDTRRRALRFGQFTWKLPTQEDFLTSFQDAFGEEKEVERRRKVEQTICEAVQDMTRRLGLLLPVFDPEIVMGWPLQRPVTLVTDTSAVLQGGLAYATRFLYPMARIKVPVVVSLEVRNMADRFLTLYRSGTAKPKCLQEHIKSQSGDRALMRLEFSDVEIERRVQDADPFRMIFTPDNENDVKSLNLHTVQKSFADRLIVESAKETRSQISPGQPLYVLTSDQGMARTAVTEGLGVMYFEARRTPQPFGKTLTGALFHPFYGQPYTISLMEVLWEAAVCFGNARLRSLDGQGEFCVTAMAEDITWFPYQAKEDLLWGILEMQGEPPS